MEPGPETNSRARLQAAWIAVMPALFVFLWATGFIGGKFGLPYAEPFTFLGLRFSIVLLLFLAISLIMRAPWPTDWRLIGHIAISGILVHAVYVGGVFSSLKLGLSTGVSALIVGMQPVLTAVIAVWFLGEQVRPRQWLGLTLGFAGILLVVSSKLTGGGFDGVWPSVIALFGITIGTLYQKRYCTTMDLRTGSVIQFAAASIAIWTLALLFETLAVDWTPSFVFALGWLVVVLSLGAISLLMALIRRGVASKVASLFYLVPPLTAFLGYLMFGEQLGGTELAGMAATAVGVYLVIRS
jgi:drug/metabolite transporter (DMT)-like permease